MVKAVWECSADTEAQRILYTARQIAHGFYQQHNFFVLPKLTGTAKCATVVFPNLHYCSIHNFWSRVKNIDIDHLPLAVEPKLFEQIKALLDFKPPEFKAVKAKWQKAETEILRAINRLIPSPDGLIRSLTVWPTNYGTTCSFNLTEKYPAEIKIFLRNDCGVRQITEAILTSLIRKKTERDLGAGWNETELITDWLTSCSFLTKIINKYTEGQYAPTLALTRNPQNGRLLKQSIAYLKKLGVGQTPPPELNRLANLSLREKNLLKVLLEKRGQIISLDEINDIISASGGPEFSLYAISKTLERLRKKLEENNLPGALVQTVRKQGWILG